MLAVFYQRNVIPDIVMEHEDGERVALLDTKYKRMHFGGRSSTAWETSTVTTFSRLRPT